MAMVVLPDAGLTSEKFDRLVPMMKRTFTKLVAFDSAQQWQLLITIKPSALLSDLVVHTVLDLLGRNMEGTCWFD